MNEEQHNPWQVKGSRQEYDNPWIMVTHYEVINPSGGAGIYGKVHFKNRAIGILPLDAGGNTYIVGQFRFPINQYSWEMPEGGGKMEDDPLEAAKRELKEETGLVATNWTKLVELHLSNSVTDELAILYLATGLEQHAPEPEETEQLVVKKIPFEEMYQMVERGIITDAMTVAGVLKVKLLLLEGSIKL
jgi:8-oxo-dGTP pyrophosphatase MutT (NUDIX family)